MRMRRLRWFLVTAVGAMTVTLAAVAAVQDEPAVPAGEQEEPVVSGFAELGVCATCHEDQAISLKKTTHGRTEAKTWDGAASCDALTMRSRIR